KAKDDLFGPNSEQRAQRQESSPEGRGRSPGGDPGGGKDRDEQEDANPGRLDRSRGPDHAADGQGDDGEKTEDRGGVAGEDEQGKAETSPARLGGPRRQRKALPETSPR